MQFVGILFVGSRSVCMLWNDRHVVVFFLQVLVKLQRVVQEASKCLTDPGLFELVVSCIDVQTNMNAYGAVSLVWYWINS